MASGTNDEQLTSFLLVNVNYDACLLKNEEHVTEQIKDYLESSEKSSGGKFVTGGFVRNPNTEKLEYIVHYANKRTAERVLKKRELVVKCDDQQLVLTVIPCPSDLQKTVMKERTYSDGESDSADSNSNSDQNTKFTELNKESSPTSSGSSDIEIIEPEGYVFVNQKVPKCTGDGQIPEILKANFPKTGIHHATCERDSCVISKVGQVEGSCNLYECFDDVSIGDLNEWSRSIIIEDVPEDISCILRLLLETKSRGGGDIITYERNTSSSQVLVTFEDPKVAENVLNMKELKLMQQAMRVRQPLLVVEDARDAQVLYARTDLPRTETGMEDTIENDTKLEKKEEDNNITAEESLGNTTNEKKGHHAEDLKEKQEYRIEHTEKDDDNKLTKKNDQDMQLSEEKENEQQKRNEEQPREAVTDIETGDASAHQEDTKKENKKEATGKTDRNEEMGDHKDVDAAKGNDKKAIETTEENQWKNGERLNSDKVVDGKYKGDANEDTTCDADSYQEDTEKEIKAATGKTEDKEEMSDHSDVDAAKENNDQKVIKSNEDNDWKNSDRLDSDKVVDGKHKDDYNQDTTLEEVEEHCRNNEWATYGGVNSGYTGVGEQPKERFSSVLVSGIRSDETLEVMEMYMQNPKKGGGKIIDLKFDKFQAEVLVTFMDSEVAENFLRQKAITIFNHTLYISSPEKNKAQIEKPMDFQELGDEMEEQNQTIEVHGVKSPEIADLVVGLLSNQRKGGGEILSDSLDEETGILTLKFEEQTVANKILGKGSIAILQHKLPVFTTAKSRISLSESELEQDISNDRVTISLSESELKQDINNKVDVSHQDDVEHTEANQQTNLEASVIEVRGFSSNTTENDIEMIFESKRYTEIADIEVTKIQFLKGEGRALLTVSNPEYAEKLIAKGSIIFNNNTLTITKPSNNCQLKEELVREVEEEKVQDSDRMVVVSNIPPDMKNETLMMILESKRHSGGEVEDMDYKEGEDMAVVTFKDSMVAASLIANETIQFKNYFLKIKKQVKNESGRREHIVDFDVSRAEETGEEKGQSISRGRVTELEEEKIQDCDRTVVVSNIPSHMKNETLMMILESKRHSGGEVEDMDYKEGEDTAVVTFKDPAVAASLVENETIQFKNYFLKIKKQIKEGRRKHNSDFHVSKGKRESQSNSLSNPDLEVFNTIKVTGIPPGLSEDMITMYFESKLRSGGGDLKLLEFCKDKGTIVIKFDDPKVAFNVCNRDHIMSKAKLYISALEMPVEGTESCAMEVRGLSTGISKEFLVLYFENRNRSGGGPVEEVILDPELKSAIVVFKDSSSVSGVLKQQLHKINNITVEIKVLEPAPPAPLFLQDFDVTRLLAKRLPPSATMQSLKQYIGRKSSAKMLGWTLGSRRSKALLDFDSEPDYLAIRHLVSSKPFQGKMISIQRVPRTSSILVTEIPSTVSLDYIAMYFENPRNGGTGDECKVEMISDKCSAIVTFPSTEVIQNIVSLQHILEKNPVKVQPYYPWLGLIFSTVDKGGSPASVTISCDEEAMKLIKKHSQLEKEIRDSLEKVECSIQWPTEGKAEVKLTYKGKQQPSNGWEVQSQEILMKYVSELTWKKENLLQEIWNKFKSQVEDVLRKSKLQIDCRFDNDQCEINYMGNKKATDKFEATFHKIKSVLEEELRKRKEKISETMTNLKPHQLSLLNVADFSKKIAQAHPGVEVDFRRTEVFLCGNPDDVKQAKLFILERATNTVQFDVEISESKCKAFEKDEVRQYLEEEMIKRGICTSWAINERKIIVYAFDDKTAKNAVDFLQTEVVEEHIQLSEASRTLIQSEMWMNFVRSLCDENKSLEIIFGGPTILAVCLKNLIEGIKRRINEFIEKNVTVDEFVPMDVGFVDFITRCLKADFQKIEASLNECGGRLSPKMDVGNSGFTINANEANAGKARGALQKLSESVSVHDHEIDRPGIPEYFYSKQGTEVIGGIQVKHNASIQLDNSPSIAVVNPKSEQNRVEVTPGKFIVLVKGDITKYKVDAIVNAANEDLNHIGGVAAAIANAAGYKLVEDCIYRIKSDGKVLPGQACTTCAGKLPCKKVIHVVGPRWEGGKAGEANVLFAAVDSALNEADKEGLKTIAMPAISTGIFGFPLDNAIDIIVDAVKDYLVSGNRSCVKEVHFIDNDFKTVASFESKLKTIQPLVPEQPENRGKGRNHQRRSDAHYTAAEQKKELKGFRPDGKDTIQTSEGVKVVLVKGSISTLQVDVIANSTGKDLNLSHGSVSKSLLNVAGPSIQSECSKKKPANFDYGDIVVTSGYNLKCKLVYHGSCRGWVNGAGKCEETVRTFMKNLLERAELDKMKSIAIPAIGTGNLGIPHRLITDIMFDEVEKFSNRYKPTYLLDIRFVVYDKDNDSIKAFEEKMRDLGASRSAEGNFAHSPRASSTVHVASSSVALSFDHNTNTIKIGTLEIRLKEGDITKEQADAIVNSTDEKLNMTGGAVAKAILKAGGVVVQAECKKVKMTNKGVCVTAGGDLPAKYIIHLVAGHNKSQWKEVIKNALSEAEQMKFSDIAFPMLGTGQIGQSASEMANIMIDAVSEFYETKKPKYLHLIRVCIFQRHMLQEFSDATSNRTSNFSNKVEGKKEQERFVHTQSSSKSSTLIPPQPQHVSRIIISIYALSQQVINSTISAIEDVIKEYIMDKVLDSPQDQLNISKLNQEQADRIKNLANYNQVQIDVENSRMKRIRIRGAPKRVTVVIDQIHAIFEEVHKEEMQKKEAEWIAVVAQWEYADGSDFEKYPDDINAIIEKAHREKKAYAEWEEQDAKYRLNFSTMEEQFLTRPGTPSVKVRRQAKSEVDIPANWETMKNSDIYCRVPLNSTDKEYKEVEKAVMSTAQNTVTQIIKIERIQNKMLYKQYVARKAAMDAANSNKTNEMSLWHGTSADTLESINSTGFNRSYCGKNAVFYGRGVYFAKNFSYSAQATYSPPDANGVKHIYLSKVLTGEYEVGNQAFVVPPLKPGSTSIRYDSTVDNATKPSIFVIFYDTQAYPEYLILFK